MAFADLRPLPCPSCGARHDLAVWLDAPGRIWHGGRRVEVVCASCSHHHELELLEPGVSIGPLRVGASGLERPALRIDQPGLTVQANPTGLTVLLGHREWFLPRPPREVAQGL